MYRIAIVIRSFPELQLWIDQLPARNRAVRIRDRAEAVLSGQTVPELSKPTVITDLDKRYLYQLIVTKEASPLLHDFCEYLDQHGYRYAPHIRWLLMGQKIPSSYQPYVWKETTKTPIQDKKVEQVDTSGTPPEPKSETQPSVQQQTHENVEQRQHEVQHNNSPQQNTQQNKQLSYPNAPAQRPIQTQSNYQTQTQTQQQPRRNPLAEALQKEKEERSRK